jgi:hypothetical protein
MPDDPRKPQDAPLKKEGGDRDVSTDVSPPSTGAPEPARQGGMIGEGGEGGGAGRGDGSRPGGMIGEG